LGWLPMIVGCAIFSLLMGIVAGRVFTRLAGLDPKTGFFCGIPGGVILMVIHAREAGLSEQKVLVAQTIRLIMVVLSYPLLVTWLAAGESDPLTPVLSEASALAGFSSDLLLWWLAGIGAAMLGKKIGIPNPWMLAPCVLAAAYTANGLGIDPVPHILIIAAQLVLGITLGSKMTPEFMKGARKLMLASVLSTLFLSLVLMAAAYGVAALSGLPLSAVLLGMAPGGMPEMSVAAHALGISVPLVLGFHFVRVVFCNLLLEPFWRCIQKLRLL